MLDTIRSACYFLTRLITGPLRRVRSRFDNSESSRRRQQQMDLDAIAECLRSRAKNVIVMTGAGISTSAGIPDFRSPSSGLYSRLQKYRLPHPTAVFTLDYFKQDPRPFYEIAFELYPTMASVKPTLAHYFIKLLDDKGRLLRHYTQNIDCLEDLAGLDEAKTVQAHGHIRTGTCLACSRSHSFDYMKTFVTRNDIPTCEACNGVIKPDVVLFGEGLPKRFWKHLLDFPKCDMLIIMGTSLVVQPFAGLAGKVDFDCPRLLINREEVGDPNMFGSMLTSLFGLNPDFGSDDNRHRDYFLQGDCDDNCLHLAKRLGWEQELLDMMRQRNEHLDLNGRGLF